MITKKAMINCIFVIVALLFNKPFYRHLLNVKKKSIKNVFHLTELLD